MRGREGGWEGFKAYPKPKTPHSLFGVQICAHPSWLSFLSLPVALDMLYTNGLRVEFDLFFSWGGAGLVRKQKNNARTRGE